MAYPNFGKVKTIVLPFNLQDDNGISLDEYKEKYGIDIRDLFVLNSNGLFDKRDFKDTAFYVECSSFARLDDNAGTGVKVIVPVLVFTNDDYSLIRIEYRNILPFTNDDSTTELVCLTILIDFESISIEISRNQILFNE